MKNQPRIHTVAQDDRQRSKAGRYGFTIIELLVVISIGLIILTIAVPAFRSMSYSSSRSLAVNSLSAATKMARDIALSTGQDGAVIFVYDPQVGKIQIIPAVKIGTVREGTTAANGPDNAVGLGDLPYFDRDIFVPASAGEVLEVPRYWMVRGYASPRMLIDFDSAGNAAATWYTSAVYGGTNDSDAIKEEAHWLFPETGFYPYDAQVAGGGLDGGLDGVDADHSTNRQTFMIRFNGRNGALSRDMSSALFINPRNSRERPYGDRPTSHEQTLRVDMAEDLEVWANRIVLSSDLNGNNNAYGRDDNELRQMLIGNVSNDTILVKPVSRIALYDERRLGLAVGARGLNTTTQSLYQGADQTDRDTEIEFDMALFSNGISEDDLLVQINQWVNGDTNFDDSFDLDDEPESRLYLIQAYTGELLEVLR